MMTINTLDKYIGIKNISIRTYCSEMSQLHLVQGIYIGTKGSGQELFNH